MLQSQPPLPTSRGSVQLGFPKCFQVMEMSCFNMTSCAANGDLLHLLKWGIDAHRNKHSQTPKEKNYLGKCDNDTEWHWVLLLLKMQTDFFPLRWCAKYLGGKKEAIQWNLVLYLAAYFKTCFSTKKTFQVKIQTSHIGIQGAPPPSGLPALSPLSLVLFTSPCSSQHRLLTVLTTYWFSKVQINICSMSTIHLEFY